MKMYQNVFHGVIASLLVISGIGVAATLGLFLWVGVGMILSYPAGWPQLWVSVFLGTISVALFGGIGIYQRVHSLFSPAIDPAGPQEGKATSNKEKATGNKVVEIKRDQSAAN